MMIKNNLRDLYMMAGAAGSVLIPQAMVNTWPSFFATVAPLTSKVLPACTGSCGACGGTCLTSISMLLWLGSCKYINKKS